MSKSFKRCSTHFPCWAQSFAKWGFPPCAPGYTLGILYRHWVQRMSDSHIFTIKLWLRNVLFTSYLQNIVVAKLLVFKLHHTFVWKIGFGKLFHWNILNEIFHFVFIHPNMFIFCGFRQESIWARSKNWFNVNGLYLSCTKHLSHVCFSNEIAIACRKLLSAITTMMISNIIRSSSFVSALLMNLILASVCLWGLCHHWMVFAVYTRGDWKEKFNSAKFCPCKWAKM